MKMKEELSPETTPDVKEAYSAVDAIVMQLELSMLKKKDWNEFRNTGLLLFINQILHVFGWAIVFDFEEDGSLKEVYPARTKFRGFDGDSVSESYLKIGKYLAENADELYEEAKE